MRTGPPRNRKRGQSINCYFTPPAFDNSFAINEANANAEDRKRVADAFRDSGVELVGFGTACEYQSPDRATLQKNIDLTKAFIVLAHDCGASGVKVRPNGLPKEVPTAKTLVQIGQALGELAAFGEGYGVVLRLEVHGPGTDKLENIQTIMEAADHPDGQNYLCWQDEAGLVNLKNASPLTTY